MKKIWWHSKYGDSLALIPLFEDAGHDITVFISNKDSKQMYDGMTNKISYFPELQIKKGDLVVFDANDPISATQGDRLRKRGVSVFGGQVFADKIEHDRIFGTKFMVDNGIKIPETWHFKKPEDCIKFLADKGDRRWVFKPLGDAPSADTYVSSSSDDMIDFIKSIKKKTEAILQAYVPGIEHPTYSWFAQGKPCPNTFHTIETKRFASWRGGIGIGDNTGCQSSVEWAENGLESREVEEGIGLCFDALEKEQFSGCLDLNCIIADADCTDFTADETVQGGECLGGTEYKKGDMLGLEWTPRFGYNSIYCFAELINEPFDKFIIRLAEGDNSEIDVDTESFGVCTRVTILPYPIEGEDKFLEELYQKTADRPIKLNEHKGITYNLIDVKKVNGELVTAGSDALIVEVAGKFKDLDKATDEICTAIEDIELKGKMARSDMFLRAQVELKKLEGLGYEKVEM
jgi:phosphoribosylamine--glycine ligase